MLGGYDHLLFVLGIAVLFPRPWEVLKAVTLFTLGHSLTLLAATLVGLTVGPLLVDAVVALSVAYVGGEILLTREQPVSVSRARVAIFSFGLVHGLGLSTRLQALGLPQDDPLARVLAFNVGVEAGQLAALVVFLALVYVLRRRSLLERLKPQAGSALGVAGLGLCLYFVVLMSVGATA